MSKYLGLGIFLIGIGQFAGTIFALKGVYCYLLDDWRAFGFFWGGMLMLVSATMLMYAAQKERLRQLDLGNKNEMEHFK